MSRPVTLTEIESAVRDSPSAGQCWTSAYVIRALLGGKIVLAEIAGTEPKQRHAWNRLPGGVDIDITRDQFECEPGLVECDVPEEIIVSVSGAQAELLILRVRTALGLAASEVDSERHVDGYRIELTEKPS